MSGLPYSAHRVDTSHGPAEALEMLPEIFAARGYVTHGLYKNPILTAVDGFDQGFDAFRRSPGETNEGESADTLTDDGLAWLASRLGTSAPFFLYLHYQDPHNPYKAPEPHYLMFDSEGNTSSYTGESWELTRLRELEGEPSQDDVARIKALYDGELHHMDRQIGRLLEGIEALGLRDDTVIALIADHGEEFYEHGDWGHHKLWNEQIRVPLLIEAPGYGARRVSDP